MNQRIVCAANRIDGEYIVCGVRHFDEIMCRQMQDVRLHAVVEQGFVDSKGTFLTREEAWKVADATGQIIRRVGGDSDGVLYSENLY